MYTKLVSTLMVTLETYAEIAKAQSTKFNAPIVQDNVVFVGVGENDGSSTFHVLRNGTELGTYSLPFTNKWWEVGKNFNALWKNNAQAPSSTTFEF